MEEEQIPTAYIVNTVRECLEESTEEIKKALNEQLVEIRKMLDGKKQGRESGLEEHIHGYEIGDFLGGGAHGVVYSAQNLNSGEVFALKEISLANNQITRSLARELSILFSVDHPNIVRIEEAFYHSDKVYLIMEMVASDLGEYLEARRGFSLDDVKKWMKQIISAVAYLHSLNIIHRDLKPENILVSGDVVKLADFGSARGWFNDVQLTPQVTTLHYRAPELLLGSQKYTSAVDIWSIGCIFAELVQRAPLFAKTGEDGVTEDDVLKRIFKTFGTPNEASWPGLTSLPKFPKDMPIYAARDSDIIPGLDDAGHEFLKLFLCCDPDKRIAAEDALSHPYLVTTAS